MTHKEQLTARVIEVADNRREFVQDVDGYVYWWPDGSTNGHLAACHLRILADELDRRNKPWDDYITENLEVMKPKPITSIINWLKEHIIHILFFAWMTLAFVIIGAMFVMR